MAEMLPSSLASSALRRDAKALPCTSPSLLSYKRIADEDHTGDRLDNNGIVY